MRWGEEPDPFGVEVDFAASPWTLTDITADLVTQGQTAAEESRNAIRRTLLEAAIGLSAALGARAAEDPMSKTEAEEILKAQGLTRKQARGVLTSYDATTFSAEGRWVLRPIPGRKGTPIGVYPVNAKRDGGVNADLISPSNDAGQKNADFRRPPGEPTAEISHFATRIESTPDEGGIYAADTNHVFQTRPTFARPARREGDPR